MILLHSLLFTLLFIFPFYFWRHDVSKPFPQYCNHTIQCYPVDDEFSSEHDFSSSCRPRTCFLSSSFLNTDESCIYIQISVMLFCVLTLILESFLLSIFLKGANNSGIDCRVRCLLCKDGSGLWCGCSNMICVCVFVCCTCVVGRCCRDVGMGVGVKELGF